MHNAPFTPTTARRPVDPYDPIPLAVVTIDDGHEVVAFVSGEIDRATCGRLRDGIEPHIAPDQHLVLDLSGVTFLDSSGIAVLEDTRARLAAARGTLVLRNLSRIADRMISVAGLHKVLAIEIG